MEKQHATLTLDNVQIHGTIGNMMVTGWMQVTDGLSDDTEQVLTKLQEGICDPWLAPRHAWLVKGHEVWAHVENVGAGSLWDEHDQSAAIAAKGITALERIIAIIRATNGSASWALLAEGADRIRNAGLPIITEGKE